MSNRTSLYRLAIRRDGHTIAAYFAEQGTMENAQLIGTMSADVAERWPDTFEAFKTAMTVVLCHMVKLKEGKEIVSVSERPAPPAERKKP